MTASGGGSLDVDARLRGKGSAPGHAHFCGICRDTWYCEQRCQYVQRQDHDACLRSLGVNLIWCPVCIDDPEPTRFRVGIKVWKRKKLVVCSRSCRRRVRREVTRERREHSDEDAEKVRRRVAWKYLERMGVERKPKAARKRRVRRKEAA